MVVKEGKPVSEVCHRFDPVPQVKRNVRYKGSAPLEDDSVKKVISDSENLLGQAGRLVIRPSGTEPVIRVMGEGDDAALVETVVNDIIDVLQKAA